MICPRRNRATSWWRGSSPQKCYTLPTYDWKPWSWILTWRLLLGYIKFHIAAGLPFDKTIRHFYKKKWTRERHMSWAFSLSWVCSMTFWCLLLEHVFLSTKRTTRSAMYGRVSDFSYDQQATDPCSHTCIVSIKTEHCTWSWFVENLVLQTDSKFGSSRTWLATTEPKANATGAAENGVLIQQPGI